MTSRRVFPQSELDRRLAPAAEQPEVPELFERLADELIRELDASSADLEIADPGSWRSESKRRRSDNPSFLDLFRADVDRIQPLDREQEARLARRIEFARRRLEAHRRREKLGGDLLDALGPRKPADTDSGVSRDLLRRTEELHALRTEMVERNLYLVLINVERYVQNGANRVDLIQEGCASLFRAVDGFDWRRGLLFRTYAVHWLNQAFRNYLYNFGSTVRVPVYLQKALKHINQAQIHLGDPNATAAEIADEAELAENLVSAAMSAARSTYSLDSALSSEEDDGNRLRDLLAEDDDELYDPHMEDVSLREGLGSALERLSEREQLVIRLRFGINEEREHTLAEVAAKLGVSVERVRQIQVRAIAKMNTPGLRRDLEPFLN